MISKLYYIHIFLVPSLTFMFLTIYQLPTLFHTYLVYIINDLELGHFKFNQENNFINIYYFFFILFGKLHLFF